LKQNFTEPNKLKYGGKKKENEKTQIGKNVVKNPTNVIFTYLILIFKFF
jgi:hypothetical protein